MDCETLLLDKRTQSLIDNYVPSGEILEGIVSFFSIFSDSTRVRILSALAITEMCVTDISRVLSINQTTVSHQLRFLKACFLLFQVSIRPCVNKRSLINTWEVCTAKIIVSIFNVYNTICTACINSVIYKH